ncbi:hypothetical protein AVEN_14994-1 [Araneus ventricosus]|uniref:Uncharacterized protein n=1 Tax=Araneus ventricosus TaxID=182803 RepID=A0A4Y2TZU8_ARAVE|nr:hypothetical protein AVEN_14994-1 [Araneus ventricosus]
METACSEVLQMDWNRSMVNVQLNSSLAGADYLTSKLGLLKDEIEEDAKKAFQSYLGVVASPPIGFEDFATEVNKYMQLPPFNFPNPVSSFGGMKKVPAEGAYLYDAVYVYARALNECLVNKEDPYDGKGMMKYIFGRTYFKGKVCPDPGQLKIVFITRTRIPLNSESERLPVGDNNGLQENLETT